MKPVADNLKLAEAELEVLKFWDEHEIFAKTLAKTRQQPPFIFYDGPPFATGLPHYGHLLAGTIKDIVPRFWTMRGRYVDRRFGWDCHGLPVEMEIEQDLGLDGKTDIERFGVARFNAECRKIVLRYTQEWEKTVRRMGRWVDFRNDYRTMDLSFMETVWWIFQQLWNQGLVYEGHKVLPFSTRLSTVLSNFEANLNYKEVQDPAITVRFAADGEENTYFIAWTTTPWTLPSNLALAVGPEIDYVKVRDHADGTRYVLAEARLKVYFPKPDSYTIEARYKGKGLVGRRFVPLLPYFTARKEQGAFRVIPADYVTTEEGTGIVHIAPAFGEDDFYACQKAGIDLVNPVDDEGRFTAEVSDFAGLHVKEADPKIIEKLKREKKLVHQGTIFHSYPYCWRSDTPLIYRAVTTWFVRVEAFRDRLVANNRLTEWVPEHLRDGRFGNWLENARDWAISRNRYWGTPLPIWKNEDGNGVVCLGSVAELAERTGVRVTDLHREFVDDLTFPAPAGKGLMRRVPYVFDCWFESGSMPYAQLHYPFEHADDFSRSFPADFIAEGLDQTRGWFYTLMVVASALFDKPAFHHVVVNGLVLAEDGKKMSKRLKNYPEPEEIMAEYGADALRLYLINSPLVRAEELRFSEQGVRDTVRRLLLPWWNAYKFFVTYASVDNWRLSQTPAGDSPNILDRWILSRQQTLIRRTSDEMEAYRLYNVVPALLDFLNELTNWYVRLNRRRFWSEGEDADKRFAYRTLYDVLVGFAKLMAPFTPFLADAIYRNLITLQEGETAESVHLEAFPAYDERLVDLKLEDAVARMQRVVLLGRSLRNERKVKVRMPLPALTILHRQERILDGLKPLEVYIREELNVKEVRYSTAEDAKVALSAKPNPQLLGPRFGKGFGAVSKQIVNLTLEQMLTLEVGETLTLNGEAFRPEEVQILRQARDGAPDVRSDRFISIEFPCVLDEELIAEGLAREVVHSIQQMRKDAGYRVEDRIEVTYEAEPRLALAIDRHLSYIQEETLARSLRRAQPVGDRVDTIDIDGDAITLGVRRDTV
ncbi:MAG: isoleucine--tRNA ligase [Deltaproteobacteria bacterium]|nr:isoleucine--tRNA ligase [Deltaproteobacteria bacterium]